MGGISRIVCLVILCTGDPVPIVVSLLSSATVVFAAAVVVKVVAVTGCSSSRCCLICASSKLKSGGLAAGVKMAIAAVTAAMDCGGEVTVPWVAAGEWAGVGGQGMMSGDVGTECVGGPRVAAAAQQGVAVVALVTALVATAPAAACALPLLELELLELEFEF